MPGPVNVEYFYRVRWGFHDEWLDLFRRNHWPLLRETMRVGKILDVHLFTPRFHGDGRADWDVMVRITYRDWAAMEGHTPEEVAHRLFPDQERYRHEEQRRFELLDAHWDVPLEEQPLSE